MRRKAIFFVFSGILLVSGVRGIAKGKARQDKTKQAAQKIPSWAQKKPDDPGYYWGLGQAPIKGYDIGKAQKKARQRAMREVGSQISVQVKSDFQNIFNCHNARCEQDLKENIRTQVQTVLNGVEEYKSFIGTKGVWVLLRLSKAKYHDDVVNAWNKKKQPMEGFVREALTAQKNGEITIAIKNLILAMDLLKRVFNGIPLVLKVEDTDREMASFLPARLSRILNHITVKALQKNVMVGHSGVSANVLWQCMYDKDGNKSPVKNMPFKVSLARCMGKFDKTANTNPNGVLTVGINSIGDCSQATLNAVMDFRELVGDIVDQGILNAIRIRPAGKQLVTRQSAVGYITGIGNMDDTIESIVRDLGFEVVHLHQSASRVAGFRGRARLFKRGIHYLLIAGISCSANFIPLYKMYKSRVSGVVKLINTRTGKRIIKTVGASGMDLSKSSACSNASGKIGRRMRGLVKDVLGHINNGI